MDDAAIHNAGDRILTGVLYRRIEYTSMWLASIVTQDEVLKDHAGFGLCSIAIASFPEGVTATYQPEYGKERVAVWGLKGTSGAMATLRRGLARSAEVVRHPDRPLLTRDQRK